MIFNSLDITSNC